MGRSRTWALLLLGFASFTQTTVAAGEFGLHAWINITTTIPLHISPCIYDRCCLLDNSAIPALMWLLY